MKMALQEVHTEQTIRAPIIVEIIVRIQEILMEEVEIEEQMIEEEEIGVEVVEVEGAINIINSHKLVSDFQNINQTTKNKEITIIMVIRDISITITNKTMLK